VSPHVPVLARLVAVTVFAWAIAATDDFTGRVVGVTDGDALTVLRGRTPVKIRLHGIDCPESGQDFGSRAKRATSELAFGKDVTVRPVDTDRYGRTVAVVVLPDGRSLNHELVRLVVQAVRPGRRDAPAAGGGGAGGAAGAVVAGVAGPAVGLAGEHGSARRPGRPGRREPRSMVYHRVTCANAARIAPANRTVFASEAAAAAAGYRPGRDCYK
jgi:hypothetical protein